MKVQVLETCDCSCQVSPNSCHFWNKRSVFLQILYQSPGSWHITPLYFLAKTLHILRSLSKYKFGEILCEQSKVWNFAFWWAPLVQIMYIFSQKITEELSLMTLNSDPKFKEKLTFYLKNDISNLMHFNLSSEKSGNFHFDGIFLSKVCNVWAETT